MKHKKISVLSKIKKTKIKFKELSSDFTKDNIIACKIDMHFNNEAVIEECKTIIDYSDERISLSVAGGVVIFEGTNLTLYSFEESTAIIRGYIITVSFEV